jgi:uncharacterized protein (DUF1778 family)
MPVAESKRDKSILPLAGSTKKPARPEARETLNMRVRPEVRGLIDHVAALTGKNRTDFMLEAARQAAENAILDHTLICLSEKSYEAFVALPDAPPNPNERLRKTMRTKPLWE